MKNIKKINTKRKMLWWLATILEYIIVPLYLASMGYEFDISLYTTVKDWQHVAILYYVLSCIDIALFMYFVIIYRKEKQLKLMGVSVFCCLTQIVLLISKVKL